MKLTNNRNFLTGAVLAFLLFSLNLQAATITVNAPDGTIADDGLCSISEAIMAANTDDVVSVMAGECPAGSGDDEIELTTDINLLTAIDTTTDRTGTPAITSKLNINGNGLTIQRDQNLSCNLSDNHTLKNFRILLVASGGELSLQDISLKNGCLSFGFFSSGAAIYNKGTITSIHNVSFQSNRAKHEGGAIFLAPGSRIDAITHSEFLENFARSAGGGAISMERADITLIEDSLFDANTTHASYRDGGGGGGALYMRDSSIGTLRNSAFSENMATSNGSGSGGAIFIENSVITLLENSTFSKNSVSWFGGAIFVFYDGSVTLKNATFYQNTAARADAIYIFEEVGFNSSNNLFVGHDQDCYIQSPDSTSINNNNLSTLTNGGCPGALATTLTAATIGELAENGGPTMTHALLAGSEALDSAIAGTSTDQRGFAAFQTRDIGAYELQGIELCPVGLKTDGFTTTVIDSDELIQAMECANFNGEANGGDTINLGADITLTETYEYDATIGRTGTPAITSKLIINGNGLTIQRDQNLSCSTSVSYSILNFRILLVESGGELNLHDINLKNGCLTTTQFLNNGAAIYNKGIITSIHNVSFQSNHTNSAGGAIYLASGSRIDAITDSEFLENFARGLGGGAIQMKSADITLIEDSLFDANTTHASYRNVQGGGGALYMRDSSIGTLRNSTFSENMAAPSGGDGSGGAIFIENSVITLLENSTFSKNSVSLFGGAIFVFYDGSVTLKNATFYQNTAARADAIYIYEEVGFNSSNNLFVGHDQDCYIQRPDSTSINNNNLSTLTNGGCKGVLATTLTAATIGELADNGGSTMTHALLAGSEALDSAIAGTSTDQRGFAASDIRDIGAFEAHVPSIVAPADFTSEATSPLSSPDLGLASVADVDEEGLVGIANPENNFAVGMTTVTWTVTDSQAFSDTDTQIVTIVDTTPPTVTAPADISLEATAPNTVVDLGTATATDLVDDIVTATADISSPFAVGVHTVTWSATDNATNSGTATQTVTVIDSTAPVLSLLGSDPITLLVGDTFTDAGATATDLVDDDNSLTSNIVASNLPNTNMAGTYVVNYDVSDIAGNTALTLNRTVNVLATLGGSLTGLAAGNSIEIQNNGSDNLKLNSDGGFTFTTPLALNDAYNVTVLTQPMSPEQTCSVSSGSGTITAGNINSVVINCDTNTYTIGGTISGLAVGNDVVLQNNTGDDLTVNSNGSFTFTTPLADGTAYTVTISQQPTNQTCAVNNGSGTLAGSNVADVQVNCSDNSITLSSESLSYGNVDTGRGSTNTITVTNNGSADVTITGLTDPASPFSITGGSCTGLPVTLAAGESCEIRVLFNPVDEGAFDGSFQIISNAESSPDEVTLFGTSRILTVPTLSQWALLLMTMLMIGVVVQRRHRSH